MRAIKCHCCGGSDFRTEKEYLVCNYCETKFILDDAFHSYSQSAVVSGGKMHKPNEMLKSNSQSTISLGDDVKRVLEKCKSDPRRAKKYANLVLDIDPTNQEALKYL